MCKFAPMLLKRLFGWIVSLCRQRKITKSTDICLSVDSVRSFFVDGQRLLSFSIPAHDSFGDAGLARFGLTDDFGASIGIAGGVVMIERDL